MTVLVKHKEKKWSFLEKDERLLKKKNKGVTRKYGEKNMVVARCVPKLVAILATSFVWTAMCNSQTIQ